ncbi:transketolase [Bacillus sp. OxB-1]|nr:transketolase [Bacillus sp. OxB-1]
MFKDEINEEFMAFKEANEGNFTWWNYVNMKSDIHTALGFAKFFYPDIVEVEGCFLLKDKFSQKNFSRWKEDYQNDKVTIEKMMNLYQVKDFFHINVGEKDLRDPIQALGEALRQFWSLSFKDRFPHRNIVVSVFEEEDGELFITVHEQ